MFRPAALILALALCVSSSRAQTPDLPPGFVRLADIAPTIRQDIRYAGPFNFTARPVPGYEAPRCLLLRAAAEALARAQERLARDGFHLKVYDCYRPERAVRAFIAWANRPGEDWGKRVFYPDLDKRHLFALGYLAAWSSHSRGVSVDVGLVRADEPDRPTPRHAGRCDGPFAGRADESSLDFGTAYDCSSPRSATAHAHLTPAARANRDRLVHALVREGFRNYHREWWHFEYVGAPRGRRYDIPIR
jgi:D-alanyl-D-alanine dipeptidase